MNDVDVKIFAVEKVFCHRAICFFCSVYMDKPIMIRNHHFFCCVNKNIIVCILYILGHPGMSPMRMGHPGRMPGPMNAMHEVCTWFWTSLFNIFIKIRNIWDKKCLNVKSSCSVTTPLLHTSPIFLSRLLWNCSIDIAKLNSIRTFCVTVKLSVSPKWNLTGSVKLNILS